MFFSGLCVEVFARSRVTWLVREGKVDSEWLATLVILIADELFDVLLSNVFLCWQ